jgi:DNA-binding FadR family transcriptional regulator
MDYVLDIVLNFKRNTLQPDTRFCIETTEAHREILNLVRSNQPGKARAAMIDHLAEVDGYLAKVEVAKDALLGGRPSVAESRHKKARTP